MLQVLLICVLLSMHGAAVRASEVRALVLAARVKSNIPPLSMQEAHKLFFGVPFQKNGGIVVPMLNSSDPILY
jgi:hypothetical protein